MLLQKIVLEPVQHLSNSVKYSCQLTLLNKRVPELKTATRVLFCGTKEKRNANSHLICI